MSRHASATASGPWLTPTAKRYLSPEDKAGPPAAAAAPAAEGGEAAPAGPPEAYVVTLIGVWLAGPSRSGTAVRRDLAPFAVRPDIAFGTVAVLYLLVLLWGPTAQTHRWPFVLTVAVLLALGVEVLRRQILREHPEAQGADLSESARAMFARMGRPSSGEPPRSDPPPSAT